MDTASSSLKDEMDTIISEKEIKVTGNEGRIKYTFPILPDNHEEEGLGVLPTVRYGGR